MVLPPSASIKSHFAGGLRLLPLLSATVLAAAGAVVTSSCKDDSHIDTVSVDSIDVPTMVTRDVETLISDSGVTRYRINTPIWYVYDEVDEPCWKFPQGLLLTKFDDFFRTAATVRSDSAFYLKNKQTWRLDGNVRVSNVNNERFLTQQLFWDQRAHRLYSDSFIHIERTDRVLEGYGFESNEQMTSYTIKKVSGIFPAEEFQSRQGARGDDPDEATAADGGADASADSVTPASAGPPADSPAPPPSTGPRRRGKLQM